MSAFTSLSQIIHPIALSSQAFAAPLRAPLAAVLRVVVLDVFTEHTFIGWLLMGLLAGWLSGELVRGRGFGCLGNILLGLIGAVVGGWLFEQLHIVAFGFIGGLAAATIGAVLVVALARALSGGGRD
jgi:uncharacterized membrane protein YeaQ/YmgE (transglycosylase-associated protein family)